MSRRATSIMVGMRTELTTVRTGRREVVHDLTSVCERFRCREDGLPNVPSDTDSADPERKVRLGFVVG